MTSNLEIDDQTIPDDVVDDSPTSTLQRGSTTSPTSPVHQQGILARFRYSFSNQKMKDLKRQVSHQEEEIGRLSTLLAAADQANCDLNQRLTSIVRGNPYNIYITGACRNVQVGESNTIVKNPITENLVADLEELMGKLTSAVHENTHERTNVEIKLKRNEVLLKELKDSLDMCNSMLKKLDKNTSSKIRQVKHLLESMTLDRSDDRVISDGVIQLRQLIVDRKRIVGNADALPHDVQAAITRLVNKFGHLTWHEFAEIIGVSESTIQSRGWTENVDKIEQTIVLDRDMCARILAQWISQSLDNNAEKLLNIIRGFESHLSKEMEENFQKKTVGQSNIPTVALLYECEPNQRSSMAYSETSIGSGGWSMRRVPSQTIPDHRSQFEHQIEAWKLQVDMNGKIDRVLELLEKKGQPEKRETKRSQDDAILKRINMDQQFV